MYFSLDAAHTSGGHGWPASSSEEEEIDESESEDEESEEEADDVAELNALLNNASRRDIRKLLITARKDARKSAMCMSMRCLNAQYSLYAERYILHLTVS